MGNKNYGGKTKPETVNLEPSFDPSKLCPSVEHVYEGHREYVYSICFAPNGAICSGGRAVMIWSTLGEEKRRIKKFPELCYRFVNIWCLDCSNRGDLIATGANGGKRRDNSLRLRKIYPENNPEDNSDEGENCTVLSEHRSRVTSVQFSGDDKSLLSTCGDDTIKYWDLQKQKCILKLKGCHRGSSSGVSRGQFVDPKQASPKIVATGGSDYKVKIWDLRNKKGEKCCFSFHEKHSQYVTSISTNSTNPNYVVSGGGHGIFLHDLRSQKALSKIVDYSGGKVYCADFQGKLVVSGHGGSYGSCGIKFLLFDGGNLEKIHFVRNPSRREVYSIKISDNGEYFVAGDGAKCVTLWNMFEDAGNNEQCKTDLDERVQFLKGQLLLSITRGDEEETERSSFLNVKIILESENGGKCVLNDISCFKSLF